MMSTFIHIYMSTITHMYTKTKFFHHHNNLILIAILSVFRKRAAALPWIWWQWVCLQTRCCASDKTALASQPCWSCSSSRGWSYKETQTVKLHPYPGTPKAKISTQLGSAVQQTKSSLINWLSKLHKFLPLLWTLKNTTIVSPPSRLWWKYCGWTVSFTLWPNFPSLSPVCCWLVPEEGSCVQAGLLLLCKDKLELLLLLPPPQGKDFSCVPQHPASNLRHFYSTWITLIQCRTYIHDWFFLKRKISKCGRPHSKKKWILELVIQKSYPQYQHTVKCPHLAPSIGVSIRRILTDY